MESSRGFLDQEESLEITDERAVPAKSYHLAHLELSVAGLI